MMYIPFHMRMLLTPPEGIGGKPMTDADRFYVEVIEDYTEELLQRSGPFYTLALAERRADKLVDEYDTAIRGVAVRVVDEMGNEVEVE